MLHWAILIVEILSALVLGLFAIGGVCCLISVAWAKENVAQDRDGEELP